MLLDSVQHSRYSESTNLINGSQKSIAKQGLSEIFDVMVSSSQLVSRFRAELVAKLITNSLSALLIVILARLLSADEYGLLFLAISFFGVAQLFSKMGVGGSVSRYIAEYKEKNPSQIPHLIRTGLVMTVILSIIVSIAVILGNQYFSEIMGEERLSHLLIAGTGFLTFTTLVYYNRKVLQGFEAIATSAKISIVKSVSRFVFTIAFVLAGFGALGAMGGYVVSTLIASIIGFVLIYNGYYKEFDVSPMESGLMKRVVEYSIPLTATNAAAVLDRDIDTVLVGLFLNPIAVSYYVVSKQIVTFIETPVSALGFSLAPTFAAERSAGNVEEASTIYEDALINTLLLYIPAGVGILLVAEPLVELLFGSDYMGAVPVLQVLSIYAVLLASNLIAAKALNFLGRARDRAIVKIITSVMNVILNIIFIPRFGVVGAAYATIITYSIYAFCNIYIIHTELHIQLMKIGWETANIVVVSIFMGGVVYFMVDEIQGWVSLFLVVSLGVLIWGALSLLLGLIKVEDVSQLRP